MVPPNRYVVTEDQAGTRLDLFLARQDPDHSRSLYQRAIAEGRVRLNGRRARKWERLSPGDTIEVDPFGPPAVAPVPDPSVPFVVVHEDDAVLVVDKPAGVPVHPHRPEEKGTLANGLVARFPDLVGVGPQPLEPGLVHRLDTQTSGLLVVARTPAAFRSLASQFAARTVEKVYIALVLGSPPAQTTITTPIGHHPTDPRRMIVEGDPAGPPRSPRPAATHVAIRRRYAGYAEVEVRITTGRMHQIRAHLASIGHPLAGDALYQTPSQFARDRLGLARPFLHAARLAFDHPTDGRRIEVSAPLPPDLVAVLARLEEAGTDETPAEREPAAPRPARRRTARKPAVKPEGPRFIRRPGGGKASPPADEGAARPSPAQAKEAETPRSWLDLEVPSDEEIEVR
ncbi:MAG TPA: RluA family pseudouridine synthase, partial [Thermodesulfobacteriota bacterium]